MPMSDLLHIQNLSVAFQSKNSMVLAIEDLSLSLKHNQTIAIIGESGSGKSITALAVLGLLPPNAKISGKIIFTPNQGQPTNLSSIDKKVLINTRGKKIAMIFQEPLTALNPLLTCGKQLTAVIRQHLQLTKVEAKKKALDLFEKVELPHPKELFNKYPHQLSGGQRQRVMIAMAISCNPDLLIADEPTTALDSKVQFGIMMLLKKLQNESQMGIIFITHDLGLVNHFADEIIIMKSGKMVEKGTIHQVFHHPKNEYTKKLLDCRITAKPKIQNSKDIFASPNTIPVFSVDNLSVAYPLNVNFWGKIKSLRTAVDGVSFEVKSNEILGIVGESGSGKSTIAKCVVGLTQPTKGKLFFNGFSLKDVSSSIKRKIQMVFQDPYSSLQPKLTIGDAIIEAMKVNGIGSNQRERMEKTNLLLSMVGLPNEFQQKFPHECSGGQRQRIVLARALAVEPEFLVFDESISALDAPIQRQILDLILQLKNKLNFSTIFISHDLVAVHHLCDRILVLREGKIVECDKADKIFFHPKDTYTKSLIEAIPNTVQEMNSN